jgi:hypothetical protein
MLSVMVLYTKYTKGQDYIIHDNSLLNPDLPTSFIQTNPYPSTPSTICSLEIGKSFRSLSYRGIFYGGNLGIAQSPTNFGNAGGKWSFIGAWRKNYTWPLGATSVSPGIDYLVNYHRWGNYSAHFGLREVTTFVPIPYGEGTPIPPDLTQKDAVITWSYEIGQPANRLIFQSIEGTDITSVATPNHIAKEWATILSNGNIGSGISNPFAQFEINPIADPSGLNPLSMQIFDDNGFSAFRYYKAGKLALGATSSITTVPSAILNVNGDINVIGNQVIQSPLGVTSSTYKPFNVLDQNNDEIFSVYDNGGVSLNGTMWINSKSSTSNALYITKTIGSTTTNLFSLSALGDVTLHYLAGSAPLGSYINLAVDHYGTIVPGSGSYIPWLGTGNSPSGSSLIFGTNTSADINLVAGGVDFGKINGVSGAYRGYIDLKKPVAIGGYPAGTYSGTPYTVNYATASHTSSLTLEGLIPWNTTGHLNTRMLTCKNNYEITFDVGYDAVSFFGDRHNIKRDEINLFNSSGLPNLSILETAGDVHFVGNVTFDNTATFETILPLNGGSGGTSSIGNSSLSGAWQYIYGRTSNIALSDIRLKENIEPLKLGLNTILSLKPYSYHFKKNNDGLHYGFIAQELKEIFPSSIVMGKETDSTLLGVMYEEFIPILTLAIQEQQAVIDSLKQKLDLVFNSTQIRENNNIKTQKEVLNQLPLLFQNHPNPFNGLTFIDYFLPVNSTNAFLKVIDNNGKLVKAFPINQIGFGQVELDCSNLANGTYHYSLLVNSKLIDTKSMIIVANN